MELGSTVTRSVCHQYQPPRCSKWNPTPSPTIPPTSPTPQPTAVAACPEGCVNWYDGCNWCTCMGVGQCNPDSITNVHPDDCIEGRGPHCDLFDTSQPTAQTTPRPTPQGYIPSPTASPKTTDENENNDGSAPTSDSGGSNTTVIVILVVVVLLVLGFGAYWYYQTQIAVSGSDKYKSLISGGGRSGFEENKGGTELTTRLSVNKGGEAGSNRGLDETFATHDL